MCSDALSGRFTRGKNITGNYFDERLGRSQIRSGHARGGEVSRAPSKVLRLFWVRIQLQYVSVTKGNERFMFTITIPITKLPKYFVQQSSWAFGRALVPKCLFMYWHKFGTMCLEVLGHTLIIVS